MISVIMPVYNVSQYLDQCMYSVVNQTFGDIEIIMINDGSTDGSPDKCYEWAKRDSRIIFINKKNEGQGTTRNLGIHIAKGEYVIFIDPDDYWEPDTLEQAHAFIEENNADMVFFDFYNIKTDKTATGTEIKRMYISCNTTVRAPVNAFDRKDILISSQPVLWNKLIKRRLFTDHNLMMTNYLCEDASFLPLLCVKAQSICYLEKALYNYHSTRPGNISADTSRIIEIKYSMDILKRNFVDAGLADTFYHELKSLSVKLIRMGCRRAERVADKQEQESIKHQFIHFLYQNYPDLTALMNARILIWGSYNARAIIHKLLLDIKNIKHHYSYSSIISAMSDVIESKRIAALHPNKYREAMLVADINKDFANAIKNEPVSIDYLVIDLLEEINPVMRYGNSYLTKSMAFDEAQIEYSFDGGVIGFLDPDHFEIWKTKCLQFIELIKANFSDAPVILLKTKLSEVYGSYASRTMFDNVGQIRLINASLDRYYEFFETHCEGITSFELENPKLAFTDEAFDYGVFPYHMNALYYEWMADQMAMPTINGCKLPLAENLSVMGGNSAFTHARTLPRIAGM